MDLEQHTTNRTAQTRPTARICLRKGCDRRYIPRRWNQRYCQDPECLRLVRRWQAAKRRAKFRCVPETRQRLARAEQQRRKWSRAAADANDQGCDDRAWSRSRKYFRGPLCHRPGCYQPPRLSIRSPASFCSDGCRSAVRRVRDRERKWLRRKSYAGRFKRLHEYRVRNARRRQLRRAKDTGIVHTSAHSRFVDSPAAVLPYRRPLDRSLCFDTRKEVADNDPETSTRPRSHPPPPS